MTDVSHPSHVPEEEAVGALADVIARRFGERIEIPPGCLSEDQAQRLFALASRASHRQWSSRPVPEALVRLIAAVGLCAPSKSDLQQAELVFIDDPAQRQAIQALIPSMPWIASAPVFLVVCGTGRRFRRAFERVGQGFVNEHLDGFFNPVTDAAMLLMHVLVAAEAAGLVGVPISVLRDRARALADLLRLPQYTFPVAGLCLGYPLAARAVTPRFGLSQGLHRDQHRSEMAALDQALDDFDRRYVETRQAVLPVSAPPPRSWTHDKTKQYETSHRSDWGEFVRSQGFRLD